MSEMVLLMSQLTLTGKSLVLFFFVIQSHVTIRFDFAQNCGEDH